MKTISNYSKGFTLIEIMVALAVTSILLAGIYATYITQLKSHLTQQHIVEMQQNLRGAMQIMEREIRMARYDPTQNAGAGIVQMLPGSFQFTMDLDGNGALGGSNEDVRYAINTSGTSNSLGRDTGGGLQPIADYIDALNFIYLDKNGNRVTNQLNAAAVRSVQVSIVVRSSRVVPVLSYKQTDTLTYTNQRGDVILAARNDNFRRMITTSDIKFRN